MCKVWNYGEARSPSLLPAHMQRRLLTLPAHDVCATQHRRGAHLQALCLLYHRPVDLWVAVAHADRDYARKGLAAALCVAGRSGEQASISGQCCACTALVTAGRGKCAGIRPQA